MASLLERIDLPPSLRLAHLGYGTAVVGHPGTQTALFAAIAGQAAVRCLRVDRHGGISVIPKVRGLLRDSESEQEELVWILTTHGLHLIDLQTDRVIETIRDGLTTYPSRLNRLDSDHLIISWSGTSTSVVVSPKESRVVDRLRMPTVDCVIDTHPMILCSFERGVARPVDQAWRRVGPDRPLPTGAALQVGRQIAVVLTDLVPMAPGAPETVPRSRQVIALFDEGLTRLNEASVDGLQRIDDSIGDDILLGVTTDAVVLLECSTLKERSRTRVLGWDPAVGAMASNQALAVLTEPETLLPIAFNITW